MKKKELIDLVNNDCLYMQPSKRSNSGYKTIKVTDRACSCYEKNRK